MLKGVGTTEIIIIAIVLLLLFGGKKLPEFGRGLGDAMKEFKKAFSSDKSEKKEKEE
jgi:sec-independent protein translocase protein TatA